MLNKSLLSTKKHVSSGWWNDFPEMHSDLTLDDTAFGITHSQVLSYDMDGATTLNFFLPKDATKTASFEIDQYCPQVDFLSSIYTNHLDLVKTLIFFSFAPKEEIAEALCKMQPFTQLFSILTNDLKDSWSYESVQSQYVVHLQYMSYEDFVYAVLTELRTIWTLHNAIDGGYLQVIPYDTSKYINRLSCVN